MIFLNYTHEYNNFTHANAMYELYLGDLLQFLLDVHLSAALHVQSLVNDRLSEEFAHVLLVLLLRHVEAERGLRDYVSRSGHLQNTPIPINVKQRNR